MLTNNWARMVSWRRGTGPMSMAVSLLYACRRRETRRETDVWARRKRVAVLDTIFEGVPARFYEIPCG